MRLIADSKEAETCVVLLNGKRVVGFVEADDQEGWVDVLDPKSIANLAQSAPKLVSISDDDPDKEEKLEKFYTKLGEEASSTEWEPISVKRLEGEVKIINLAT